MVCDASYKIILSCDGSVIDLGDKSVNDLGSSTSQPRRPVPAVKAPPIAPPASALESSLHIALCMWKSLPARSCPRITATTRVRTQRKATTTMWSWGQHTGHGRLMACACHGSTRCMLCSSNLWARNNALIRTHGKGCAQSAWSGLVLRARGHRLRWWACIGASCHAAGARRGWAPSREAGTCSVTSLSGADLKIAGKSQSIQYFVTEHSKYQYRS